MQTVVFSIHLKVYLYFHNQESMTDKLVAETTDKNLVWQAANSVMATAKAKASPWWRFLYSLSFLALLAAVGAYGFFTRQAKAYQEKTTIEKQSIDVLNTDIAAAENNADYKKYMWAKTVYEITKNQQGWWDRLSRIITIFEDLQKIGWDAVSFSDFSLDFSSLTLKWTVADLKVVYGSWGVVDKFNALDFAKNITITDYKKTDYGYAFSLIAQILLDHVK